MATGNSSGNDADRAFCPGCGCNLDYEYQPCPQCGYSPYGKQAEEEGPKSNLDTTGMRIAVFLLGAIVTFAMTFYLGSYFLLLFFPILIFGRRRSLLMGLFDGALIGSIIGVLVTRFLI